MEREEIISKLNKYFDIQELVCPHTYKKFSEDSWVVLSTELLETILFLRDKLFAKPIYANRSNQTQRGFRCNICTIPASHTLLYDPYISAHCTGNAIDFDVKGITADEARKRIKDYANLLPYKVRLEKGTSWIHLDVYNFPSNGKVEEFNP